MDAQNVIIEKFNIIIFKKMLFFINKIKILYKNRINQIKANFELLKNAFFIEIRKKRNNLIDGISDGAIYSILSYIFIIFIIYFITFMESKYRIQICFNKTIEFYIMAIGYGGVLLGLYYASFNALLSNSYKNAPTEILKILNGNRIFRKTVRGLISFIIIIVTCIGIYILNFFNINGKVGVVTTILVLIYIVYITYEYKHTSDKLIEFNNQFKLFEDILESIIYRLHQLPGGYIRINDKKNEIYKKEQKKIREDLNKIRQITAYNLNVNNNNFAFVEAINFILNVIFININKKREIQYNSEWFPEIEKNSKYYSVDFSLYDIANRTGTLPLSKKEKCNNWIEISLVNLANDIFDKLLDCKDWNNIICYLQILREIQPEYIYFEECITVFDIVKNQVKKMIEVDFASKDENKILCIFERFFIILEDSVLALKRSIERIDYTNTIRNSASIIKNSEYDKVNIFINNEDCYNLFSSILIENEIYQETITPEKYINEIIANKIKDFFDDVIDITIKISDFINEIASLELKNSKFKEASLIYYIGINYIYKFETLDDIVYDKINLIDKEFLITDSKKIEKKIKNKFDKVVVNLFVNFGNTLIQSNLSEDIVAEKNTPDYFGYFINESSKLLMKCIQNNNFDSFKVIYSQYIFKVLYYQENIRQDLLDKKYSNNTIIKFLTEPFIKYCKISSVALIYGILCDDKRWEELVINEFLNFIKNKRGKENIISLLKYISIYKSSLLYASRDFSIDKFSSEIITGKLKPYIVNNGIYGNNYITGDKCLNKFLLHNLNVLELENLEDFYIIKIVDKEIDVKDRYNSQFGWEK